MVNPEKSQPSRYTGLRYGDVVIIHFESGGPVIHDDGVGIRLYDSSYVRPIPQFTRRYGPNNATIAIPHRTTMRNTFPRFARSHCFSATAAPGRSIVITGMNVASPTARNQPV